MPFEEPHLSDEELLLAADGELPPRRRKSVAAHLAGCWDCRTRLANLETHIADLMDWHRRNLEAPLLPKPEASRALLRARLAEIAGQPAKRPRRLESRLQAKLPAPLYAAIALAALVLAAVFVRMPSEARAIPATTLTPGATRPVALKDICGGQYTKNVQVVPLVQRQVFARYGLQHVEPSAYEVDYLITPALGGADDIRNLWPQPYSSTMWNAAVKDELEDRLHTMVCSGELDLASAQQDIATNWIAAYKKYFHTDRPIAGK